MFDEPPLHGAHRRHVGTADAEPDTEPVGGVNLREILRHAGERKADADQDHADQGNSPRAPAVGERSADGAHGEIKKTREREHERYRAARRAEILLQGVDEGAEGIDAAEADEGDG